MRILSLIMCGALLAAVGSNAACTPRQDSKPGIHQPPSIRPRFQREELLIRAQDGGQHRLKIEVARTMDELAYGLMKITALPDTEGMLFVSPTVRMQTFWMKDTLLPLDIVFINEQGRIIGIHSDAQPHSLHYITSPQPAKAVLEILGGMAARWHLTVGDKIISRDFRP
jgi:uncharacterized protein